MAYSFCLQVSFAEALEHKKLFDKNDKSLEIKVSVSYVLYRISTNNIQASTASPGKSILKEKALKKKKQMEKKVGTLSLANLVALKFLLSLIYSLSVSETSQKGKGGENGSG